MGPCWKRRFSSRISAHRAISQLRLAEKDRRKHNDRYDGARLEPYTCPECGGVHIGHRHYASKRRVLGKSTTKEQE